MRAILAKSFIVAAVLAACGDNLAKPDGSLRHDAGNPDAPSFPPPPTLGAQIDRVGRPAISTMLVGAFSPEPARTSLKDAYSRASDPATWLTTTLQPNITIEKELEISLAVFDALDTGMSMTTVPGAGCGNPLRYTGPPGNLSYQVTADVLGDDELYVDTSKSTCEIYLALEIEFFSAGSSPHTTCGGRMPTHDVIDMTYSVLAAGLSGLDKANSFAPRLRDSAAVHGDVNNVTFPFLGPPH
ncbi:MAG: DUF4331 domain-containing protein [Deltaproteobacteria bacterium]|nr:MAG: DUF4331 domain-containing protein [Deltaproteobacteria bacterium]